MAFETGGVVLKVITESGSHYTIDLEKKTWHRAKNSNSPDLRTDEGVYISMTEVEMGKSMTFICPPFVAGAMLRYIQTTPVKSISYVSSHNLNLGTGTAAP